MENIQLVVIDSVIQFLRNLKQLIRVQRSLSLSHILVDLNTFHTLVSYCCSAHFSIIFLLLQNFASCLFPSKIWTLFLQGIKLLEMRFSTQKPHVIWNKRFQVQVLPSESFLTFTEISEAIFIHPQPFVCNQYSVAAIYLLVTHSLIQTLRYFLSRLTCLLHGANSFLRTQSLNCQYQHMHNFNVTG